MTESTVLSTVLLYSHVGGEYQRGAAWLGAAQLRQDVLHEAAERRADLLRQRALEEHLQHEETHIFPDVLELSDDEQNRIIDELRARRQ